LKLTAKYRMVSYSTKL